MTKRNNMRNGRRNKNSAYVVEEQSRGAGAIASQDLGLTARASGGEILARKRASGGFPARRFAFRQGRGLPQPAREVLAQAKVPRQHYALDPYTGRGFRTEDVRLVSRPGGAQVHAGVILGDPPPAVAEAERRARAVRGRMSPVHAPRSGLQGLGQLPAFQFASATPVGPEPEPTMRLSPGARAPVTDRKRGIPNSTAESTERFQKQQEIRKMVRAAYNAAASTEAEYAEKGAPPGTRLMLFYGGDLKVTGAPVGSPDGPIHRVAYMIRRGKENTWRVYPDPYVPPPIEEVRERTATIDTQNYHRVFGSVCKMLYPEPWHERVVLPECREALKKSPPSPYGEGWQRLVAERLETYNNELSERAAPEVVERAKRALSNESTPPGAPRERPQYSADTLCAQYGEGHVHNNQATGKRYMCVDGKLVHIGSTSDPRLSAEEKEQIKDIIKGGGGGGAGSRLNPYLIGGAALGAATLLFLFLRR